MSRNRHIRFFIIILILFLITVAVVILVREYERDNEIIDYTEGVKKISLSWWGSDERHAYTMEGVKKFEEDNEGIDVVCRYGEWSGYEKKTKGWMMSHNQADVMQINYAWLNEYSKDGEGYYDLYELSDIIDLDAFTDEQKAYGERNGRLNALPIAMNTHVFYYNKDVLDEYGLKEPKTWDDLKKMGEVLSKDGKYALGMSKKQVFLLLAAYYEQSTGKAMFDADGHFIPTREEVESLLVFYRELIDSNVLCPIDSFDRNDYMTGKIAGTMCWISDTKIYCDGLKEKGAEVVRSWYPELPGAKRSGWYLKPATMWAISADTRHPEEAARLVDFLLNDPYMAMLQYTEKGIPVSKNALNALEKEGMFESTEYAATEEMNERLHEMNVIIPNMEKEEVIDAFKSGADEYLFDRTDEKECAKKIWQEIKELCG